MSKSAKINWEQRHGILRMIYRGEILPILSHGVPVWIDCPKRNNDTKFYVHGSVHRESNLITVQQDAT